MIILDDLDMGKMCIYRKFFKKRMTCKIHNVTNPGFPQECVGDCGKTGRENGATECSNIGGRKGTYDAVILEKGESSRAVRRYADVTREDVQTPLRKID